MQRCATAQQAARQGNTRQQHWREARLMQASLEAKQQHSQRQLSVRRKRDGEGGGVSGWSTPDKATMAVAYRQEAVAACGQQCGMDTGDGGIGDGEPWGSRGGGAWVAVLHSDSGHGSFGQHPLRPGRVDGGQCCRGRLLATHVETGGRHPVQPMKARWVVTQRPTGGSHRRLFLRFK
jgi:hypothetical protein